MPACTSKLVYNSILSWAGGWYFLVATEIIASGPINYRLPGLGSFLVQTTQNGQIGLTVIGLAVLISIIVIMDVLLWRPLTVWSQKFRYEFAAAAAPTYKHSALLRFFLRFRAWTLIDKGLHLTASAVRVPVSLLVRGANFTTGAVSKSSLFGRVRPYLRRVFWTAMGFSFVYLAYLAASAVVELFSKPLSKEVTQIPWALAASSGRLGLAYLIALLWTVPVAVKIGHSPRAARILTPVFEVVASIPATALFPLMVVFIVKTTGSLNLVAILLILTGMQWYLLFNLIAGTMAIPNDLKEVAQIHQLKGWLYWRRIVLPAIFPSIITGSVTAWGGGWNALIVAEYFRFDNQTYSTFGIGALLDRATFETGDSQMMLLSLIAMVGLVVFINRVFWRPLYTEAARRFTIEY